MIINGIFDRLNVNIDVYCFFRYVWTASGGLSEETKCNKRLWKEFCRKVKSWVDMECEVVYDDDGGEEETSYVLRRAGLTEVDGVQGVELV